MLLLCVGLAGCQHSTEILPANTATFALKGTVVGVDAPANQVTLQHDAVPGLMGAMTMPYKLQDAQVAHELHRGDIIRARLLMDKTGDGDYRNARLDEIAVLAEAHPNFKPQSNYHVPKPGDAVPDFHFINQDGKSIQLNQFHGKALLITFIYTRCPLGDFCPKMSRNFAAIQQALSADPRLLDHTQLLSISFDPAFDTPSVLRAYGTSYTGGSGFAHWQFAIAAKNGLPAVEQFFNVGVTEADSELTHSLSTVLVGADGRIAAWYPGSEWNPQEVIAQMKTIAESSAKQQAAVSPVRAPA
jgi:protein SCO1/2